MPRGYSRELSHPKCVRGVNMSTWLEGVQEKLNYEFPQCVGLPWDVTFRRKPRTGEPETNAVRIHRMQDIGANIEHVAIVADDLTAEELARLPDLVEQALSDKRLRVTFSNVNISRNENDNGALVFSRSVFLFVGSPVDEDVARAAFSQREMKLSFRDAKYWRELVEAKRPDVFVCHDSRDKKTFVEPLVNALSMKLLKVWFDKYSLKVGDSLVETIDEGLQACRFGVLVISSNFISRRPWPAREFRSLVTRELSEDRKIILPIWLDVTRDDVSTYSLDLVDKIALQADIGVDELARLIADEVKRIDPPAC